MRASALPINQGKVALVTLGNRTRYECTRCGEYVQLDMSPEGFEQAAMSQEQPVWLGVVKELVGEFMELHANCGGSTDASDQR